MTAETPHDHRVHPLAAPVPTRLSAALAPPSEGGIPPERGHYAWWATPESLPDVQGRSPSSDGKFGLIHIGTAPARVNGTRTMREHLVRDHLVSTRKSTLRRALASFLWQPAGWGLALTPEGKPTLDVHAEYELTLWMHEHLALTWLLDQQPGASEAATIVELRPPLNSDLNTNHPMFPLVAARRAAWAAAARAAAG